MSSNGSSVSSSHHGGTSSAPVSPASANTFATQHSPSPPRRISLELQQLLCKWGELFAGIYDADVRNRLTEALKTGLKFPDEPAFDVIREVFASTTDPEVQGRFLDMFLNDLMDRSSFTFTRGTWTLNEHTPLHMMIPDDRGYESRFIRIAALGVCRENGDAYNHLQISNFMDFFDFVREMCKEVNECTELRRTLDDQVLLYFEDVLDARDTHKALRKFQEQWPEIVYVDYITARVYNNLARGPVLYPMNGQESMIRIHVIIPNDVTDDLTFFVYHTWVMGLLANAGPIRTLSCDMYGGKVAWCQYMAEFFSCEDAMRFIETHGKIRAVVPGPGFSGIVRVEFPFPSELLCLTGLVTRGILGDIRFPHVRRFPRRANVAPHNLLYVRPDDVRTTLMLRNIPNAMTSYELKNLVDNLGRHRYNFLYLRMDFQTGNNVGYGFINFDDPQSAVDFAARWQGLTWVIGNTTKVAAVSYATTQGKENQIARFRNSGLRLQPAPNRPKLFVSMFDFPDQSTFGHVLGGEIPLPEADNSTKLNRSVQNGRNNGLYSRARRTGPTTANFEGLFDNGNPHNPVEDRSVILPYVHQFPWYH